jgi:hypothetical protein
MNLAKNILPAVYSGMNKVGASPASSASQTPHVGGTQEGGGRISPRGGVGDSIPQRDKMLLNLQAQADQKKQQIKEDYKHLKTSVKENPYLAEALTHYDEYFALQQKQINALKALLSDSALKKDDQKLIIKEIATLEKNLP